MNYLTKHWTGNIEPVWSFWINLIALTGVAYLLSLLVTELELSSEPVFESQVYVAGLLLYLTVIAPWGWLGTWRSCSMHTDKPPGPFGRALIRLMMLIWLGIVALFIYQERSVIENRFSLALELDSNGGYTVSFDPQQAEILVNGGFEIGLTDDIVALYELHPETLTIAFGTSLGGWVFEANELAQFIGENRLNTTVLSECSSACTIAYIAGAHRTLSIGASLGFHQFASQIHRDPDTGTDVNQSIAQVFFELNGVSSEFTERMFQATHDDMWYPSTHVLVSSGVIHGPAPIRETSENDITDDRLKDLLMRPEYHVIKRYYPSRYSELVDAAMTAYLAQEPWFKVQDAAATVMLALVHQTTLYLPDEQVVALTKEVESLMLNLAQDTPYACVQVIDPNNYGGVDIARLLPAELSQYYATIFAEAIQTSVQYDRYRYSIPVAEERFAEVVSNVDIELISPIVDEDLDLSIAANRESLCFANLVITGEILNSRSAAQIIRFLND